jgi:hypothetical protein
LVKEARPAGPPLSSDFSGRPRGSFPSKGRREFTVAAEEAPIDCGHPPQEEKPDDVYDPLLSFLGRPIQRGAWGWPPFCAVVAVTVL